jgi:VWFA-related protein
MRYALSLALSSYLAAQEPPFRVQSRVVLVPVTVTDSKGRFIEGLSSSDFALMDDGRPQKVIVDSFATGVAPIALVIAVQSSGISAAALEKIQKIGAMIQPLITGERGCAALVSFAERVRWLQECTNDQDAIASAFHKLQPGEEKSGRMLDAAHEAVERLRRRPDVRRVLLLISESRDRGSESDLESVVLAAQAAGVAVYAVTYSAFRTAFTSKSTHADPPPPPPVQPRANRTEPLSAKGRIPIPPPEQRLDILGGIGELVRLGKTNDTQVLTAQTGGTTLPFARQRGLEEAIEKLGSELHMQYVVSFTPDRLVAGYHNLDVRVTTRGGLRVRARPGYWSTQQPQ